ncbi:Stc1 domain-containing protein [Aspergillus karnatakaensis]|uniref:uncharacterized protein n=1 Tax=Aspergillus karnatakaensis TaxID=1810916 RepID=UPI003CCD2312
MAPKKVGTRSAYAGGWSESIRRQLESAPIPDKLRCKTCGKYRLTSHSYSNTQLDIVRNAYVVDGPGAFGLGLASCRHCTGGQTTELTCRICEITKPTTEFANAQRKELENARCLSCVQGYRETEPIVDENKLITDGDISSTKGTISDVGSSLAESTRRLTLTGTHTNGTFTERNVPLDGGLWIEPNRNDANSSTQGPNLGSFISNSQAIQTAGSTKSVHSGWEKYGVKTPKMAASVRSDTDSKFAKVRAYKPEAPTTTPTHTPTAVPKRVVESDEEDEDSDPTEFI